MRYSRRWNENDAARREFDDDFPLPKNEMSTFFGVIMAKSVDRTHGPYEVEEIAMEAGENRFTEIESSSWPDAVPKRAFECGVGAFQGE